MFFDKSLLIEYALIAFAMSSSIGPNAMYLISRSISQGYLAGFVSLLGVQTASVIFIAMSAIGVSAIIMSFPIALNIIKFCGAGYLFYLAWQSIHPNSKSIFELKPLDADSPLRLYFMGFFTNILNPKAMILFMSIMPHFVNHKIGHIYTQFAILALIQLIASIIMNGIFILSAGTIATFLNNNPKWVKIQKYLMGAILALVGISILIG